MQKLAKIVIVRRTEMFILVVSFVLASIFRPMHVMRVAMAFNILLPTILCLPINLLFAMNLSIISEVVHDILVVLSLLQ